MAGYASALAGSRTLRDLFPAPSSSLAVTPPSVAQLDLKSGVTQQDTKAAAACQTCVAAIHSGGSHKYLDSVLTARGHAARRREAVAAER